MKRTYEINNGKEIVEREYGYIPVRYIIAFMITIFEVAAIVGIVVALCYFVPYFYILAAATSVACIITIIASDDEYAMIGTINLDYRSLVHHFENGIWMYKCKSVKDIKADIDETLDKCIEITEDKLKTNLFARLVRSVVRIFAPLL